MLIKLKCFTLTLLCILLGWTFDVAGEDNFLIRNFDHIGERTIEMILSNSTHEKELSEFVLKFDTLPEYLKISLSEIIAQEIKSDSLAPIGAYIYKNGTHDLRLTAGRAAWLLEKILNIEVAALSSDVGLEQKNNLYNLITDVINKRRLLLINLDNDQDNALQKELEKLYSGKIKFGIVHGDYTRSVTLMLELMSKWQPIGKDIYYVESIVGEKLKKTEEYYFYKIDSGYTIRSFRFKHQNGIIYSVTY